MNSDDQGFILAESKEGKELMHYHEFDKDSRGSYLIQANWVELSLNDVLAAHFCPNDKDNSKLLSSLIINEISFSNKIRLFSKLLKLHYPELIEKYPHLITKLEKIRNLRNLFAHSVLDLKDEIVKRKQYDRIHLSFLKDGLEKTTVLTKDEIDEQLGDASDTMLVLINEVEPHIKKQSMMKFDSKRS